MTYGKNVPKLPTRKDDDWFIDTRLDRPEFLLERKARKDKMRISVITGPIFQQNDPKYHLAGGGDLGTLEPDGHTVIPIRSYEDIVV